MQNVLAFKVLAVLSSAIFGLRPYFQVDVGGGPERFLLGYLFVCLLCFWWRFLVFWWGFFFGVFVVVVWVFCFVFCLFGGSWVFYLFETFLPWCYSFPNYLLGFWGDCYCSLVSQLEGETTCKLSLCTSVCKHAFKITLYIMIVLSDS